MFGFFQEVGSTSQFVSYLSEVVLEVEMRVKVEAQKPNSWLNRVIVDVLKWHHKSRVRVTAFIVIHAAPNVQSLSVYILFLMTKIVYLVLSGWRASLLALNQSLNL